MPLTRTKNVVQLEVAGELPSQYLCRFASQCDDNNVLCPAEQPEDDHVVLEMPVDLTFPVRHRCCRAATYWVRALATVLSASHVYQRHVLASWELLCGQNGKKRKGLSVPWFRRASRFDRKFQTMKILASNPFISPYLAPSWMLEKMPPCYFVGLHLDPTLDDLVMLSKRLRNANNSVQLEILDNLPHAFLNFCLSAKKPTKVPRGVLR
uniref:Putative hormone-sensitive lipase hsl n=1 Tax=Amblyomma triste TaxID=251400 RepID=A0A023GA71_AMBTT